MSIDRKVAQIAWVVPDIAAAERFFRDSLGAPPFFKVATPGAIFDLCYSGDTMLELIQPVSGPSIYADFLERHGGGGVHHVAVMVEASEFDAAVADLTGKGHPVITTQTLPIARVAYVDTGAAIGVATEIIGLTEAGHEWIRKLKNGDY
jgi:catechol 2,3-dioxygenase-like lactoylglutathione lyase family enzyme